MLLEQTQLKLLLILFLTGTIFNSCHDKENELPRKVIILKKGWKFLNEDIKGSDPVNIDALTWQEVSVPHDWAISGDFDPEIDKQAVAILENSEEKPTMKTGRTGALPHIGVGWYYRELDIPSGLEGKRIFIEFDGAMSHAKVFMNGRYVGEWPYGYASFGFDLTDKVIFGGKNELAVRLENKPYSSRWYPGAGIYRHVRLVITDKVHIPLWGTFVTTPEVEAGSGKVNLATTLVNADRDEARIRLVTEIFDPGQKSVARMNVEIMLDDTLIHNQSLNVENPRLWSVHQPLLYTVVSRIFRDEKLVDQYKTIFGFRYFEFTNNKGFFLNGKNMKLNGVCLHHDLGPLGTALNISAIERQLDMLKEMGCNAIRTSHNPPAPELLELTDEMGFLVIDEAFDEWKHGKVANGYHTLWDDWAEKDMTAMIRRDRNHPSVILWSIGNEIREQGIDGGDKYCRFLVEICKQEDPTRPTTAGFNQWEEAIKNGFAEIVDVPGWNYKPQHYNFIHNKFPYWKIYGSETASTVSSRGEYFFPAEPCVHCIREPYHCSSYDLEYPWWATSPDTEFAAQDSFPFVAGEFVWTGFDYLGEPTPYDEQWPSRSSYFGMIDLCGIPKDRYYLYQSQWTDKEVLHLLPHWNWEGMEGQNIPVHCYTSFNKVELFLNGESMGIREKGSSDLYTMYRLVWKEVSYEPGELKVVALDENNNPLKEAMMKTAGKPAKIILTPDRNVISLQENELSFVTVSVVDENGVSCPRASNKIFFITEGSGSVKAVGNGDPTSLESFVKPERHAFNGKCMVFLQPECEGEIGLTAYSEGLETSKIKVSITK